MASGYTIAEAARLVGLSPQRVSQLLAKGEFSRLGDELPIRLKAEAVDALRAKNLAKFDGVLDTLDRSAGAVVALNEMATHWLHRQTESRAMITEGIALVRQGEQVLVDAMRDALRDRHHPFAE